MQRWAGKVALVTGASEGVGKATAKILLQNGMKVIGCGRNLQNLKALEEDIGSLGELTTVKCDVSKEDQVNDMFSQIGQKYGGLDVCINNAGLGVDAPILSGKSEDWQLMLDVNIMGLLRVTREAVAAMKAKGASEGHIININSISGHRVRNNGKGHIYSATKFAVTAITNGTRHELLDERPGLKCRVSQISPGLIDTPFIKKHVGEEMAKASLSRYKVLEARDIAETVIYQLGLPQHAQVQDVIMRATDQLD